jgi:hypothetical protein
MAAHEDHIPHDRLCRADNRALRPADIGNHGPGRGMRHNLVEQFNVLLDGRGQHDEVGASHRRHVLARIMNGAPRNRLVEHRLAVDTHDVHRWPGFAGPEGDRAPDEPKADDGDLLKGRIGHG